MHGVAVHLASWTSMVNRRSLGKEPAPDLRTEPLSRCRAQSSMTDGDAQVRGAMWTAVRACRSVGPDCASRLRERLIWQAPADSRRRSVDARRGHW